MTTTTATLASKHADSLIESINARVDAGAPFGHMNELEEWHDVDECPTDCEQVEASAYDYLQDALDIQYLVTSSRDYRSARVMVSFGGPNVWIDTNSKHLEVHWGFDSEYRKLPSAFISALDDALAELWEMGA